MTAGLLLRLTRMRNVTVYGRSCMASRFYGGGSLAPKIEPLSMQIREETEHAYHEIMEGRGYYVLEKVHTEEEIAMAQKLILDNVPSDDQNLLNLRVGTPFENQSDEEKKTDDSAPLNKRLYHLLPRHRILRDMATHPRVMALLYRILGRGFINGTYSANVLYPGTQKQEPHLDYPYWDAYQAENFPETFFKPSSFPPHVLACQTLTPITEYNSTTGGVGLVPNSHKYGRWPDGETWEREHIQPTVEPGSVFCHTALLWHAAMTNFSDDVRIGISGQWLPRYVKPMEDIGATLTKEHIEDSAHPDVMKQLCGEFYAYPTTFGVEKVA